MIVMAGGVSCMGKNTPERKDYIMENLVMTVEE